MVAIGIIGPGLVGKQVIKQLEYVISVGNHFHLHLAGICTSKFMFINNQTPPNSNDDLMQENNRKPIENVGVFVSACLDSISIGAKENGGLILVDCTSSMDIASMYPSWLSRGISIVTPNKKAFSADIQLWKNIKDKSGIKSSNGHNYPMVYHESSVGAGLPIISTIKDLVSTGDEIHRIEGILSGTLSFIFNTFCRQDYHGSFSDIVNQAKQLGYTVFSPPYYNSPKDDLNGMDVARKVIILARVSGLDLSMDGNCTIENLIPEPLRQVSSVDEFIKSLPEFDHLMQKLKQEAARDGQVLRYVGVVDIVNKRGHVKIEMYPQEHPFAQMQGSDNILSIHTERYGTNPLVIRGAGAGDKVTAHGVVSDILKCAEILFNRNE